LSKIRAIRSILNMQADAAKRSTLPQGVDRFVAFRLITRMPEILLSALRCNAQSQSMCGPYGRVAQVAWHASSRPLYLFNPFFRGALSFCWTVHLQNCVIERGQLSLRRQMRLRA
jgi:hypothetical protein